MRKSLRYSIIVTISGIALFSGLPAYASTGGTIQSGGGNVNLRSGPGTNYPIVGTIAQGTAVSIDCVGYGTAVTGPYGTTTLWDEIGNGHWVTDAFVNTGTNLPIAMPCSTTPTLGPGSGSIDTSVLSGCDFTNGGGGLNHASQTSGLDWWTVSLGCQSGYDYTYGNGYSPSGQDYAIWGYFPGAYAICHIYVHIPSEADNPKPFTNAAHYQVYTNNGGSTLLSDTYIDQYQSQGQDILLGVWEADGSGYLRVRMDDSSGSGNDSQIVVASQMQFDCTSAY